MKYFLFKRFILPIVLFVLLSFTNLKAQNSKTIEFHLFTGECLSSQSKDWVNTEQLFFSINNNGLDETSIKPQIIIKSAKGEILKEIYQNDLNGFVNIKVGNTLIYPLSFAMLFKSQAFVFEEGQSYFVQVALVPSNRLSTYEKKDYKVKCLNAKLIFEEMNPPKEFRLAVNPELIANKQQNYFEQSTYNGLSSNYTGSSKNVAYNFPQAYYSNGPSNVQNEESYFLAIQGFADKIVSSIEKLIDFKLNEFALKTNTPYDDGIKERLYFNSEELEDHKDIKIEFKKQSTSPGIVIKGDKETISLNLNIKEEKEQPLVINDHESLVENIVLEDSVVLKEESISQGETIVEEGEIISNVETLNNEEDQKWESILARLAALESAKKDQENRIAMLEKEKEDLLLYIASLDNDSSQKAETMNMLDATKEDTKTFNEVNEVAKQSNSKKKGTPKAEDSSLVGSMEKMNTEEQKSTEPLNYATEYRIEFLKLRNLFTIETDFFKDLKEYEVNYSDKDGYYHYTIGKTNDFTKIQEIFAEISLIHKKARIVRFDDESNVFLALD